MNKNYILIKILTLIFLIFSLSIVIIPTINTLSAQSTITKIALNPVKGIVGANLIISGENFAGSSATITWDSKVVAKDININDGRFKHIIPVPESSKGKHTVSVTDNSNWAGSAAVADFNILPSIKLSPNAIEKTSQFSISGQGFIANESNVNIILDGNTFSHDSINANTLGTWNISLSFNNIDKGRHTISASGPSTNSSEIGEVPLIVIPWAEVEPTSGPVGTQLLIYGWGFRHNEDGITITMDNEIIETNITAEMDGSLIADGSRKENGDYRASVYIPETTKGEHIIGIYGSSFTPKGIFPDHLFKVIPQLSIEPDRGKKAAIISIKGTGFAKGEGINLKYDDVEINTGITADDTGTFNFEFVIPQSTREEHLFSAIGNAANSATAKFILENIEGNIIPTVLEPANGQKVSAFNSIGEVYTGIFQYIGGLGNYLKGKQSKTDGDVVTVLRWAMSGETGNWEFLLQVSKYPDFSSLSLEKHVPSGTEYKITRHDALPNGIYYWRVNANSEEGKITQWSEVNQFEIIPIPTNIAIISWVLLLVIIAAIVFIIILIRANITKYHY